MSKVDFIHGSAGEGHRRAAICGKSVLEHYSSSSYDIRVLDALDYGGSFFKKNYAGLYYWCVKHMPFLWGWFYEFFDIPWVYAIIKYPRRLFNCFYGRKIVSDFIQRESDIIIATHFFPSEVLGRAKVKGKIKSTIITFITDFYPHTFWVNPGVDYYWVLSDEGKMDLEKRGVPSEKITVGGFPIDLKFFESPEKNALYEKYNLDPNRFTILLTSGSFGLGQQLETLQLLEQFSDKIQCLVVCGNNESLYQELSQKTFSYPTKVYGFIDFMPDLMHLSDLMIGKPGGSTSAEALICNLPIIIVGAIPGQEGRNVKLLTDRKAAYSIKNISELTPLINDLLSNSTTRQEMLDSILKLAKPKVGEDLTHFVQEKVNSND